MSTKQELESNVADARKALSDAEAALYAFGSLADNNVFDALDKALSSVEDKLSDMAFEDCQGAHNCGAPQYTQEFIVDGVKYRGILTVEYNRYDKTYYYIDSSTFEHEVMEPELTPTASPRSASLSS